MTRESLQICEQVEEFLISRLSVDSPYTKKKVFTIIKSLAQNGDPMFAKNMARKVEELKKYTSFALLLLIPNDSIFIFLKRL